ncbi:MAG: glycosyltransferase [Aggregatilineales bacterium]
MTKIAWLTPFSRSSAIGQYSAIILEKLAAMAEVTIFASDLKDRAQAWLPDSNLRLLKSERPAAVEAALTASDVAIYNLGNYYPYHGIIWDYSRRFPGICILHDFVMHPFFIDYYTQQRRDHIGYLREVTYAHGEAGRALGEKVVRGEVNSMFFWSSPTLLDYSMAKAALRGAEGAVVHSAYALGRLTEFSGFPVKHIQFPTPTIAHHPLAKSAPPQPRETVKLLTYGMINPNKCVDQVIEAIGTSSVLRSQISYDVIGKLEPTYERLLHSHIDKYSLQEHITLHGYQPDETLYQMMADADIIINLRNPHYGESSWSLLEAAFFGRATMVWKHGYYDEFPDNAVVKVNSLDTLRDELEKLVSNAQERHRRAERLRAYAESTFVTERYCEELLNFIERIQRQRPLLGLADFAAEQLYLLGAESDSNVVRRVADEVDRLRPS